MLDARVVTTKNQKLHLIRPQKSLLCPVTPRRAAPVPYRYGTVVLPAFQPSTAETNTGNEYVWVTFPHCQLRDLLLQLGASA
ncbi:leucine rich repeat domain-containing protein [Histoplasma capsulatum var. duboisii H88]|uniref:Leucine rich repeat domain-containing protein n=1 Tax=Ajellomyces capsulatus (strain H88) TaxID=544711 RepID=A0A8A1L5D8_AJEC8|nr:leucine rich repeat domain-containing protein [Histoplasma capsulatum var. duboisii H88]